MHRTVGLVVLLCSFGTLAFVGCTSDTSSGPTTMPNYDGGSDPSDGGTSTDTGAPQAALEPCPASASGTGTEHKNDITADETWTLAGSPHRLTFNTRILATVRIEACATVLVDNGYSITIGNTPNVVGTLIAHGEHGVGKDGKPLQRPVTFGTSDPAKPWGSIFVNGSGKLDLEDVVLTDGASPDSDQNGGGVVITYGNDVGSGTVAKTVRAVNVTVDKSRGYGFNFQSYTGFTDDSSNVVVTNGGRADAAFPVRLLPGTLATLPTITLTGNVANEVEVIADNVAMTNDTIKARGVPYRVRGRMRVAPAADGAAVTLTIEAGATLRFDSASDNGLEVGSSDKRQGVLVANGTASSPITFTSAKDAPAPADWKNIYFNYSPPSGSSITNAVIEYAGGPSGAQGYGCGPIENDASVLILTGRPDTGFIQNTTFRHGGGDTGLLLGWVSDQSGPDFVGTNTFTDVPACKVSRWRNATGTACPGSTAGSPVCL